MEGRTRGWEGRSKGEWGRERKMGELGRNSALLVGGIDAPICVDHFAASPSDALTVIVVVW